MDIKEIDIQLGRSIESLMEYGIEKNLMDPLDIPMVRNELMELCQLSLPGDELLETVIYNKDQRIDILLDYILDLIVGKGIIEDTITERDLFDSKLMGCLMPRPSELNRQYKHIKEGLSGEAATDFFYNISKDSNYIRMDRINRNLYWQTPTQYGDLEITVNLSKPEKDPKEIEKAKHLPQVGYPKCLLCVENVGYQGRLNHPGRANHRVLPLEMDNEPWYFQYSPYVYYNEHSIVFKGAHEPMHIHEKTFKRIVDFLDQMPHYFIGSNADLPIVGGSILSHDHFQGGRHVFPMETAPIIKKLEFKDMPDMDVSIIKWPLSVVRLSSMNKEALVKKATQILDTWREYSDVGLDILAYTENNGEKIPHNTITPIGRKNEQGAYELDLVLRNNRTSDDHPLGIFHPHAHLHHIKKENIGLIEVMGLAVLPARLKDEMVIVNNMLRGFEEIDQLPEEMLQHKSWIENLIEEHGCNLSENAAKLVIEASIGHIFGEVLTCCGVFKLDEAGLLGIEKFLNHL